jgi:Ca-activated chloride channel homolog
MKLSVQTDRRLIRAAGSSRRYALARIVAPMAAPREQRSPINVAFVLDRSGSMHDERKFGLAKEAAQRALRMLRPEDRFALVVYDDRVDTVSPLTRATSSSVEATLARLASIEPRGGTDLGAGWITGAELLVPVGEWGAINRCLLLSDGLANHGITDRRQLARVATMLRRKGVVTSTFGVGADFDEHLLRDISRASGGNAWFIEGAPQMPKSWPRSWRRRWRSRRSRPSSASRCPQDARRAQSIASASRRLTTPRTAGSSSATW